MRRLEAVTFDFWSTLVDGSTTPERTARRMARLHAAIAGAGATCTPDELLAAFNRLTEQFDGSTQEMVEDVGPPGRWALLARALSIPEGLIPFEVVEQAYEDLTLNPLPDLMPYIHDAVQAVQAAGYRLGVICNTGMAGGRTLREVLKRHGLLDCFEVTVFSNEFGVPKPQPSIFEHTLAELGGVAPERALHVGDIEWLDVRGARRTGMHAALYAPASNSQVETEADFVVRDWREFATQIQQFSARDTGFSPPGRG